MLHRFWPLDGIQSCIDWNRQGCAVEIPRIKSNFAIEGIIICFVFVGIISWMFLCSHHHVTSTWLGHQPWHTHTHSTSTTVKSPGYSTRAVKFVPPKKIRTKTWDTWVSKGIVRHNSNRKILFNPFLITQIYTCHKQTGFYTQLCQVMEKLVCHSTILPAWPMQKSHLMPCIRSHTPTSTTKLVGILVCKKLPHPET